LKRSNPNRWISSWTTDPLKPLAASTGTLLSHFYKGGNASGAATPGSPGEIAGEMVIGLFLEIGGHIAVLPIKTRKPCCHTDTIRCCNCSFRFKFANNIQNKFKSSQASNSKHTGAKHNLTQNQGRSRRSGRSSHGRTTFSAKLVFLLFL